MYTPPKTELSHLLHIYTSTRRGHAHGQDYDDYGYEILLLMQRASVVLLQFGFTPKFKKFLRFPVTSNLAAHA